MSSIPKQLETAVASAINSGSYSQAITAERKIRMNDSLETIRAASVPLVRVKCNGVTTEPADRGSMAADYKVLVVVRSSAAQSGNDVDESAVESSLVLVEEIQDELSKDSNSVLSSLFTFIPSVVNDPIYDDERLKADTIFESVSEFTYRVLRNY